MTIAPGGWRLYGAPWLQPAAIAGKSTGLETAKTSEIRCRRLPPDGKEGVDGSSPSEVALQFYGCG